MKGMSFEERSSDSEEEVSHDEEDGGSGGGAFHDHDLQILISSTNDVANFDDSPNFKKVYTLWICWLMITISVGIFIFSAIVPFECDRHTSVEPTTGTDLTKKPALCLIRPLSLLLYMHCAMWGVYLICDQCIQYEHAKMRRRGYLDFYNETRVSSKLPFWIVSAWSTLLLVVATVLHDHCKSDIDCAKSIHLTRTEYITICLGLETLSLLVVMRSYIYKVWRFNSNKDPPDVFRDDMMSCTLDFSPNSLGLIDEEIFHRQADLIRYYKERNVILQKTVVQLNKQVAVLAMPKANTDPTVNI